MQSLSIGNCSSNTFESDGRVKDKGCKKTAAVTAYLANEGNPVRFASERIKCISLQPHYIYNLNRLFQ